MLLNRTFIIFKYKDILKMNIYIYIIFNFICIYFIIMKLLYYYYKNKCESVLYFYTIKIWKKN